MRLYHFTSPRYHDAIMSQGLLYGDIPISQTAEKNGVWFTTRSNPGQGKDHGLNNEKRRMRITVSLRKDRLKKWSIWSKSRLEPQWLDTLTSAGGGQKVADTWWLSLRPVMPQCFTAVEIRNEDGVWTDAQTAEPNLFGDQLSRADMVKVGPGVYAESWMRAA